MKEAQHGEYSLTNFDNIILKIHIFSCTALNYMCSDDSTFLKYIDCFSKYLQKEKKIVNYLFESLHNCTHY